MRAHIIFFSFSFVVLISGMAYANEGQTITAEAALGLLKKGNDSYVASGQIDPDISEERRVETSKNGQAPYATILSCSDSRVPVEHIFSAGVGDLFVIRVAGNVSDIDEIGTIEYGTEHLGTPVVLVLGHTSCGAVTAVTRGDEVGGSIPSLVDNIIPAKETVFAKFGKNTDSETIAKVIEENVWQSIRDLFANSEIVRELVEEEKLLVVGGIYHLDTGKIDWLGELPGQQAFLEKAGEAVTAGTPKNAITRAILFNTSLIAVLILVFVLFISGKRPFTSISIKKSLYIAQLSMLLGASSLVVFATSMVSTLDGPFGIFLLIAPGFLAVFFFATLSAQSIYRTFRELVDYIKGRQKTR